MDKLGPHFLAVVALLLTACGSGDRTDGAMDPPTNPATEVFDANGASLGSVEFPVSCSDTAAETMRLGLALLHNMTYPEAQGAFGAAAEEDPSCALAYWGMAMTYVHPLWSDVPADGDLDRGWDLLQEARSVGLSTSREEAYVAALEAYYQNGSTRQESERLASFAAAWGEARANHPEDPEIALFHALSMTAAAPGGDMTFAAQREAGELVEAVLARIPDHPGAHHYLIHAYDSPPLAEGALPAARRYGEVAPENTHALHMTSHIFTRLGLWAESIEYNARSADAAVGDRADGAVSMNHMHANDYLAYALLQRGDDSGAREVLDHLASLDGPIQNHSASAYALAAVPARIPLETQDWAAASRVAVRVPATIPWDDYPFAEAIPVFARTLGAARTGEIESAREALARLVVLREQTAAVPIAYDWESQVRIQELAGQAWIAYAEGRIDEGLELMRESADLESRVEKSAVTPGEVLPARELLGDMLLDLGRFEEARVAYVDALERSPNRFNSLYGAGRAAELSGDPGGAVAFYRRLVEVASEASGRERLDHARTVVD